MFYFIKDNYSKNFIYLLFLYLNLHILKHLFQSYIYIFDFIIYLTHNFNDTLTSYVGVT